MKEVFQISSNELELHFSDNISVFDQVIPDEIPRKGESLCKTAAYWFEKTEELGFNTHFIEMSEEDKMKVESVDLIDNYDEIDQETTGYRVPLEFVSRYYVAGSLYERLQEGEIDHEELGFTEQPEYGEHLPEPLLEVITKLEDNSRIVDRDEALSLSGLTEKEFDRIKEIVFEIDNMIKNTSEDNGLIQVDSKKEFAMTDEREPMVIDSFGTIDEDRFWDREDYEEGNFIQKNKEFIRQYYKEIGYYDELMKSSEDGEKEPPIPSLPNEMIEKASKIYIDLMFKLTNGTYGDSI